MQLANVLVHHKYVMALPVDWWIHPDTRLHTACTVQCLSREKIAGKVYINCHFLEPDDMREQGITMQLPVDRYFAVQNWNVRRYLDLQFNRPQTLHDIGLSKYAMATVAASLLSAWSTVLPDSTVRSDYVQHVAEEPAAPLTGPFDNDAMNHIWSCQVTTEAGQKLPELEYDLLADIDTLEPDPPNYQIALKHPRLRPFWINESLQEMDGLFEKGCFRKHKLADLRSRDPEVKMCDLAFTATSSGM